METIRELTGRHVQTGRVAWIGVRPGRRAAVAAVEAARIGAEGLEGDHARPGRRSVTLIQAEHLAAVAAYLGRGEIAPGLLRRNIAVAGLNLSALNGWVVRIGSAELRITGICAPCSRMEAALGPGGYNALRGHGGWCAEVVGPGQAAVGDAVLPVSR
jgi:MOSC domain-containing protein YiiM